MSFLKEEQANLLRSPLAELTFSMSCLSCHFFHNGPSFRHETPTRIATTPEELLSFHERGQAPSSLYRIRRSFRLGLIDWRYRREAEAARRTK